MTSKSIAFKDWSLVCAALAQGKQSVILRKGGIAEGRGGFQFKHPEFWLFPTQFHEQAEKVRPESLAAVGPTSVPHEGQVQIGSLFKVEHALWIEDWDQARRLAPFHIWREEVVRERFDYAQPAGVQCAFGRVWNLPASRSLTDRPSYGGCRSWINLEEPLADDALIPAISDEKHRELALDFFAALAPAVAV